jgi:hypothetical protein
VEYSASGDGATAYIVAKNLGDGKELWRVRVFRVQIDPTREHDVQEIFISGLKLDGNGLLIRNEAGQCFRVDLQKRSAKGVRCTRKK